MRSDSARLLNVIQIFAEIAIAAGFALGLIPFVYLWSFHWVVPLTFVSAIIAVIAGNRTFGLASANVVLGLVSLIPIIGFVTRILGIVVSLIIISTLRRQGRYSGY